MNTVVGFLLIAVVLVVAALALRANQRSSTTSGRVMTGLVATLCGVTGLVILAVAVL